MVHDPSVGSVRLFLMLDYEISTDSYPFPLDVPFLPTPHKNLKKSEGAKCFWLLLRKNHNPPLQNVLYLAEWG